MSVKLQRENLTEKFVESFISAIVGGEYLPGEKIPSEAEIAERFGISRTLVREGIGRLASIGMIDKRQGMVSKIAPRRRWNFLNHSLLKVIIGVDSLRNDAVNGIFSMRILLEGHAAAEAAKRRTNEDLARIAEVIAQEELNIKDPEFLIAADRRLHDFISESLHDMIFASVLRNFQEVLGEAGFTMIVRDSDGSIPIGHHKEIYRCLQKRDAEGARAAMEKHLRWTIANAAIGS